MEMCRKLRSSWILICIGLFFMFTFEQMGVLLAILPFAVAQNVRLEHDKVLLNRCKENQLAMFFVATYYLLLLCFVVAAIMKGIDIVRTVQFSLAFLAFFFPILIGMLVGDILECKGKNRLDDK